MTNCSSGVMPLEARYLTLAPQQAVQVLPPLQLYVQDNAAMAQRNCWVTLLNSQVRGAVYLSWRLAWWTRI